jgi:hypothetical protein
VVGEAVISFLLISNLADVQTQVVFQQCFASKDQGSHLSCLFPLFVIVAEKNVHGNSSRRMQYSAHQPSISHVQDELM